MPEGHTLHRLATEHDRLLAGHRLAVSSPQGRFAAAAAVLDGRCFESAEAYGKHLFHHWEGAQVVHIHLGLYGRFRRSPAPPQPTLLQVRMRLVSETDVIDLSGATRCELTDLAGRDAAIARLGPDPLRRDADPERAWARIERSTTPIGKALMDQTVLAGVGNVYRAEVLRAFGVHPLLPARELGRQRFDEMWAWIVKALRRGVKEGRIVTVEADEVGRRRRRDVRADEAQRVYMRDACSACGTPVRRWDLGGRWAYACESCQPPP